jgi:hypothetical protein
MESINRKPNRHATEIASLLVGAYVAGKSIPEISDRFGIPRSTVRARLLSNGVAMRSAVVGMTKAKREGRGISPRCGKYERTAEIRAKLSAARIANANATASGVSKKPSGYLEVTRGENKGRGAHVVAMEKALGVRIPAGFVVHHVDEIRDDNDLDNLALMTRAAHARLHALENLPNRKRDALGRLA